MSALLENLLLPANPGCDFWRKKKVLTQNFKGWVLNQHVLPVHMHMHQYCTTINLEYLKPTNSIVYVLISVSLFRSLSVR